MTKISDVGTELIGEELGDDTEFDPDDDGQVGDSDDEPSDDETASLEDLYENEIVAEQASNAAVEDDEELIVKAIESAGDEPVEALTTSVRPRASGEFICQECFLIKPAVQLANRKRSICVDCV